MAKGRSFAIDATRGVLLVIVNLIFYAFVIVALFQVCKYSYHFAYQVFGNVEAEEPPGKDITLRIEKADVGDLLALSKKLEDKKLVVNAYSFYIRLKLTLDEEHSIVPGQYALNTSETYDELLDKIVKSEQG